MFDENLTIGENRVRTQFNPAFDDTVALIKQTGARLINLINQLPVDSNLPGAAELHRLKAVAMTEQETATEKAVKAATFYFK